MAEVVITIDNYEKEVNRSDIPVLLDLWAPWCGPCRMLGPVVSEIAEEYAGKIKVGKINVDEQEELLAQFRVSSIPMLVLVEDGKVVNTSVGYIPKTQIVEFISSKKS